jgi:hypothetical protein
MNFVRKHWLLLLVVLIGAIVRLVGIYPGFNAYHSDEPIFYGYTVDMVVNKTLDPIAYCYGSLVQLMHYISYRVFFIPISWLSYYFRHYDDLLLGLIHLPMTVVDSKRVFWEEIVGIRGVNALYWSRYITAVFSLGTIPVIYLVGKYLFNKKVGLIAAFFLAINYKSVVYAHLGLPDAYSAFFLVLAFLSAILVYQRQSSKYYVLAGIASALSFSVKYQFFSFFPLFLAHFLGSFEGKQLSLVKFFRKEAFISFFTIPFVFLLINPYVFVNFEKALGEIRSGTGRYGVGTFKLNLYPFSYLFHYDYGWPLCLAIILGILISFKNFLKQTLFLLSVVLPFYYMYTYYSHGAFFVRNMLVMTPFLIIFGSVALWTIFKKSNIVLILFCLLVAIIPAKNSIITTYYLTKPWNYVLLSDWMRDNYPKGDVLAAHPFDPPGREGDTKTEFYIGRNYSLAEHKVAGAKWALINFGWASDDFYLWLTCDPRSFKQCWNKPLLLMRNTYNGLAAEEIARYGVYYAVKPWQVPDSDLILSKIPQWPDVKMTDVKILPSLQLGPECNNVLNREWSEPIKVDPEHLYSITAKLRRDGDITNAQKDGFLRIDFYKDLPKTKDSLGMISSISERLSQKGTWLEVEMLERAPLGSRYLVISLQSDACKGETVYQVENIIVQNSLGPVEDVTTKPPYTKREVDLDIIYPNSYGGF